MEAISIFDIFKIGVGPSSSHTMGPWRAAERFLKKCQKLQVFDIIRHIQVNLYGSLAKTGKGHGTDIAVIMGLLGQDPVSCQTEQIETLLDSFATEKTLALCGHHVIPFHLEKDIVFNFHITLPFHPNGIAFKAFLENDLSVEQTYYSIGGGFIIQENEVEEEKAVILPRPIHVAKDLQNYATSHNQTIPEIVWENELSWRTESEIEEGICLLWDTMKSSIFRGIQKDGLLPGGLSVKRRAHQMNLNLLGDRKFSSVDEWIEAIQTSPQNFQRILKWVSCFALAVNEENASFGRVVTAPTNGAAGVIPAVMMYYVCFCEEFEQSGITTFLLTAGEIGSLFKKGATISAALGGCQAEIGVSSAMAAAGLTACLGGTTEQCLMAAEIAMEHHLGLTCDPIGGLVQVPCIERNTMGAVKAITACKIALESDPHAAKVPLDAVIRSMWETALDMNSKYKETSEGGLAINIPVNVIEC